MSREFISISTMLSDFASEKPASIAYKFFKEQGEVVYTWHELDRHARKVCASLQLNCKKGERALLFVPSGVDYIAAFFGCLYAGIIAVPAYPPRQSLHMARLQSIIDDAQASVILTTTAAKKKITSHLPVVLIDDDNPLEINAVSIFNPSYDDIAFFQYTSGSTGTPKGVMISHGNLISNLNEMAILFLKHTAIKPFSWLPPYHDMGLIAGVLLPLYVKQPGLLMAPGTFVRDPLRWLKIISKEQVTFSPAPNFAYDLCVKALRKERDIELDLRHWKIAANGAEPVRLSTIDCFVEAFGKFGFTPEKMLPCYGMAEATLMVSSKIPGAPIKSLNVDRKALEKNQITLAINHCPEKTLQLISCGKVIENHTLLIVDPKFMTVLPPFKVGEIWVSGSSITQGYWQNDAANQKEFVEHQGLLFYKSGDLGFVDDTGELFITGRLKDLMIIRGRNIYPQDIEHAVVESHSSLIKNGGAAFGLDTGHEEGLVIVQEVDRHQKELRVIYEAILQKLAFEFNLTPYKIILIQQASLPKTSSGKLQRSACRHALLTGQLHSRGEWNVPLEKQEDVSQLKHDTKLSEVSQKIVEWLINWTAACRQIQKSDIHASQKFIHLGLDSLMMVQLSIELSAWLQFDVNLSLLWEFPSIEKLAAYLTQELNVRKIESRRNVNATHVLNDMVF